MSLHQSIKWFLLGVIVLLILVGVFGVALAQSNDARQSQTINEKIEADLAGTLNGGPADFIVRFSEQADLSAAYQMSWKMRGEFVYSTLQATAERSQSQAKNILDSSGLQHHTFIAGNELYVWAGTLEAADALAALPEVQNLRLTRTYHVDPIVRLKALDEVAWIGDLLSLDYGPKIELDPQAAYDWGILDVHADQFWSTFGVQGAGITVANIDTGVQWDHPALINQYKCAANPTDPACWYDPSNVCGGGVCDNNGHGTHTMGTMAANDDPALPYIAGMAPDSQWIACKGCETNSCSDFALNSCADWILAPGGNPSNRPHVVNNSWGGGGCDTWYLSKVQSWRAAGTFPAFSAGNNYGCNSLGSPGDYQESFGSASHRSWDRLISDFSSKGPSCFGHDPYTKPNISAPGENICSTVPGGWDCSYSGTSMASPHSAGAVALLWSCNPGLVGQIDQTFEILQDNADAPPAGSCGAPPDGEGNYTYGYGYLNVFTAGQSWCGETGTLNGVVTDSTTANPIYLAHVYSTPGPYTTHTDPTGYYSMMMGVGTYTVTAEAWGYYPEVAVVGIITDTTTTQDFALDPAPAYVVDGYVTDALTGWPLYASLDVAGYPYGTLWTDPVTGYYSVTLPAGSSYDFTVNAWVAGYLTQARTVGPVSGSLTENFALDADLVACTAPGYGITYSEDFQADNGSFNTYGYGLGGNSWEWGPYPSPYPGPGQNNVWSTGLTHNYYDGEDSYIESPDIDLTSLVGQWFDFSWWQKLITENWYDPDYVEIQASNDGGASWYTVYGPASGYIDYQWTQRSVTLDPMFAVGNFRVRFYLHSGSLYTESGWDVDNLVIGSCQPRPGGLVVGNVYESNLGMPLTGAVVTNDSGGSAATVVTADPSVDDSFYTLFSPSATHVFTATFPQYNTLAIAVDVPAGGTIQQDFYLPAGHLVANPDHLSASLELGSLVTTSLDLVNDGDGAAGFEIREKDRGFVPVASAFAFQVESGGRSSQGQDFPKLASRPVDMLAADVLLIQDWDAWGYPAITSILNTNSIAYDLINSYQISSWDFTPYKMIIIPSVQGYDYYNNFNGNLAKFETYIDDGGLVLMSFCTGGESVMIPFGGSNPWNPQSENYIVDPSHPIFTGVPNPYWGSSASHNVFFGLLPDDRILVTAGSSPGGEPVMFERDAGGGMLVAGGQTFEYGWGNGQGAGLILQNMIPYYYFNWQGGSDVPWLAESPITGTVPANTTQPIAVTFDASMLGQPGNYQAELRIKNDTPYGPVNVPVTMTVTPPADWGKLEGVVSSLGYCDNEFIPLDEAMLQIQSSSGMTWTVETDDTGYYSWWLDQDGRPFTVTVSYAEHLPGLASGVVITGGQTTTLPFSLRWLKPCLAVDPAALSATLMLGSSATLPITLTNSGAAGTDFSLSEADRGFIPVGQSAGTIIWLKHPDTPVPVNGSDSGQTVAYPGAYRYIPARPRLDVNILMYVDEWQHIHPNTYPEQAIIRLGLPAEIHFDGDYTGFETALNTGGPWDLVIWQGENYYINPWPTLLTSLRTYVEGGGKLAGTYFAQYDYPSDPLWSAMGFQYIANDMTAPPAYWWEPDHNIFNNPEQAPEWLIRFARSGNSQGSYIEPLANGQAMAGYTLAPATDQANIVIGNDGQTVYKGIRDLSTDADDDFDGVPDAVELWENIMIGLLEGFGGDVPWLSEVPITGTLPADVGEQVIQVSFDSTVVHQPGDHLAILKVKSDDPVFDPLPVGITMTVLPPPDWGKVAGVVYSQGYCDQNPAPIEGAEVVVDVSGVPYTFTADASGFYSAWFEQGQYNVSASADEHLDALTSVVITAGQTTTLDLWLRWVAPCISGAPTSYSVEVPQGFSFDFPFSVVNQGAGEGEFKLRDRTLQEVLWRNQSIAYPQALVPPDQQQAKNTLALNLPQLPQAKPLDAGDVIQTWNPSSQSEAWGIAYDGADDTVWVGDGWGSPYIYEYAPNGTPTGRSQQYAWGPFFGPADDAFNWNTGMLWTLDVGGDDCIHEMDPAAGYTGNQICGPWGISQRGVAYDPATDTWFVGGWNEGVIYHIDSSGNLLDSAYVGLYISGLAYNPATMHLFVMVNFFDEPVYVLDAANNYQVIGQFYIDNWQNNYNGAGLEIDCDGNLWAVAQNQNKVYQFESGETASLCEPGFDAPWLTQSPQEGVVLADSAYPVDLTFTAFPTMSIGSHYTATLTLKSSDPVSDTFRVPVTMTVIQPVIAVGLVPTDTLQHSPPGTVAIYPVTVHNLGNVPDTYHLALEGGMWNTLMLDDEVSLDVGESATLNVYVFIPSTAQDGEVDALTFRATSHLRADVAATAQLSTMAFYPRIVRLNPATASDIGDLGDVIAYEMTLWNYSMVTDTIELTSVSGWEMHMSQTIFTLGSYESVRVTVYVHVPFAAAPGDIDIQDLIATSQSDPTAHDVSRMTSHAGIMHLRLPLLLR